MKKLICFAGFIFFSLIASSQTDEECKKVKTGTFRSEINIEGKSFVTMIYRKKGKQIEENVQMGIKMEFDVKWTSSCSYELSNPKIVKGEVPDVSPDQIFYVKILSASKEGYTAEVSANFHDGKIIFDFIVVK